MEANSSSFAELIRVNSDSVAANQPKLFRGYAKTANIVPTQLKRRDKLELRNLETRSTTR